jgi:hypothetical protein
MTRFVARQLSTAHWFDISAARRDHFAEFLCGDPARQPVRELYRRHWTGQPLAGCPQVFELIPDTYQVTIKHDSEDPASRLEEALRE